METAFIVLEQTTVRGLCQEIWKCDVFNFVNISMTL